MGVNYSTSTRLSASVKTDMSIKNKMIEGTKLQYFIEEISDFEVRMVRKTCSVEGFDTHD